MKGLISTSGGGLRDIPILQNILPPKNHKSTKTFTKITYITPTPNSLNIILRTLLPIYMQHVFHHSNTPSWMQQNNFFSQGLASPIHLSKSTMLFHNQPYLVTFNKKNTASVLSNYKSNKINLTKNQTTQFTLSFKTTTKISWTSQAGSHTNHYEAMNTFS